MFDRSLFHFHQGVPIMVVLCCTCCCCFSSHPTISSFRGTLASCTYFHCHPLVRIATRTPVNQERKNHFYNLWQINTNKHEWSNPKKQKPIAMRTSRIMVHSKCKDFLCNKCSIFVIQASLTITCARGKLQAFASPKLQTPRTMKLSLFRFAVVHACPASRPHS